MTTVQTNVHSLLRSSIATILDECESTQSPMVPTAIGNRMVAEFAEGAGEVPQWAVYYVCRDMAGRMIRGRCPTDPEGKSAQLTLPGWEHMQRWYLVHRDGEYQGVPVGRCTKDELLAIAAEKDKVGATYVAHATEIRQYVAERFGA